MSFKRNALKAVSTGTENIIKVKNQVLMFVPFWIAGSLTALVSTLYAKIFAAAEAYAFQMYNLSGYWFIFLPVIFFLMSWCFVVLFAPRANGSGIPQLMAAIELLHQKKDSSIVSLLGVRVALVKIISSLFAVLGGGAIGREGPTLQISSSIFSVFADKWKISEIQNKSAFVMAGAASGLASAFNTPLGGIVFVIEELAKSHLNTFRTGVLHSVIFAGIISQLIMGPYLYLGFPKVEESKSSYLLQYLVIACASALVAIFFVALLKNIVIFREKLFNFRAQFFIVIVVGLLFGFYSVFVSNSILGSGNHLLNQLLFESKSAGFIEVFSRLLGSLLTYSTGGAGGIFAPILSVSGAAGSYIDHLMNIDLGPLAVLIGMTAGLSALTHSPLTSFILILEMTDRHRAILPLMMSAIVGHGLSKVLLKTSFYEFVCSSILKQIFAKSDEFKNET